MSESPFGQPESGDHETQPARTPAEDVPVLDLELLPQVVSELASTSEQQAHRLADLTGTVSELGGTIATALDELESVRAFLLELHTNLADREDLSRLNQWTWVALDRDQAAQLWRELRWFVDHLVARYPLSSDVSIPPCWYRHTVAVDELTDLYAAWRMAYSSGDRPSEEMIAWRTRWMWPSLHTLHSHADWRECKAQRQHVEPTARQDPTDPDFDDFVEHYLATTPPEQRRDLPWQV
ncbi:hypothetical protein [Lentzea sp. NPDC059081]|uniref:hypothetical protein n=1 Tax=Lentzea sp. NPDC059081 TaxID=3346719 RepID=UPI0036C4EA2D